MKIRRPLCLVCIVFLCIVYVFMKGKPPSPSWDVDYFNGRMIMISGRITDRQIKNGILNIYLNDVSIERNTFLKGTDKADFPEKIKGIVIKVTDYEDIVQYVKLGAYLDAKGVFEPFEKPMNEGQFDSRSYYMIRGYEGMLKRAKITGVTQNYSRVNEGLRRFRDRAFETIEEYMGQEDGGLVAAMTLGDKSGLDTELKELYQNAGISHVLALSGLHIASVGLCILKILRKTGVRLSFAAAISGGLVCVYGIMTGLSTSTLRAMIMFALAVVALIIGRTYDLLSAAALSAILIIVENPGYIFDSGFLLSFGAVVAIGVVFPIVNEVGTEILSCSCRIIKETVKIKSHTINSKLDKTESPSLCHGFFETLQQGICISISVTIVTLPVMTYSFFQVSRYSILLNLIIIPLMGVVLATGFAGIALGLVANALDLGYLRFCTGCIFKITEVILKIYQILGELTTNLSSNLSLFGRPKIWQIVAYSILAITGVIFGNRAISKKNGKDDVRMQKEKRSLLLLSVSLFVLGALILKIHPIAGLEIRNVFVGQGDCAVITGKNQPVIVIDGGSTDVKSVGKYRILPVLKSNAISQIDFCFLTHPDEDHINGIIEILEDPTCGVKIKNLVMGTEILSDFITENDSYDRLISAIKSSGAKFLTVSAGDVLSLDDLKITCINPGDSDNSDLNDSSIVLSVKYVPADFDMMFTGDISSEAEQDIVARLENHKDLLDCDYLKVPHHGSRNSSSKEFLEMVSPKLSVISAGIDNSYGHPHKETLCRLESVGTKIYCTAEDGEVITKVDKDGKVVVTRGRR